MKKAKKIASIVLAATMLASICSGCKKKETVNTTDGGVYSPQKELSVTVWNAQGTEYVPGESPTENIPKKWLEEKTKVKIGNIYGNDGGQWDTKLSRLIAGDNLPELFYVAGGQGPSHFKKLKNAKKLYPLTEVMIKQYAPNVWERVPDDYWKMMRDEDGTILGIPFGYDRYDAETQPDASEEDRAFMLKQNTTQVTNYVSLHIRDDIAKQLFGDIKGFDDLCKIINEKQQPLGEDNNHFAVQSTDDYIKMFRDINNLNLKENGKKVYAFGYSGGDLWIPLTILGASMYGYATNTYITHWNPNTKEVDVPLREEIIKSAAKTQNMLVREGAFDPESLIHSLSEFKENCLNGLYAVTNLDSIGGFIAVNEQLEQLGKSFRYIPLITNVPQNSDYPLQYYKSPWTAAITLTDKLDDEGAKQILNWINTQFSDEFEEVLWWGTPEDGLYTEENGVRKYVDDKFNKAYLDGDTKALTINESRGIGSVPNSEFYILAGFVPSVSRWNPTVMNKVDKVTTSMEKAFIPNEADKNAVMRPQCDVYDATYAQIDECVDFWSKREQWESPFKMALGSDSEASFETQWKTAVDNLNKIADIDGMCKKMTEKARAQAQELGLE